MLVNIENEAWKALLIADLDYVMAGMFEKQTFRGVASVSTF